jgi:hypothetical protein
MRANRLASLGAVLCVMLVAGGCGAEPPQAPPRQAAKLDSSLSGIATACGLTDQLSAFAPPPAAQLAVLEATAGTQAAKLAAVYRANPRWIYQGEAVRRIVDQAISLLDSCRLSKAQAALARATGR